MFSGMLLNAEDRPSRISKTPQVEKGTTRTILKSTEEDPSPVSLAGEASDGSGLAEGAAFSARYVRKNKSRENGNRC
jgi:hypothetical protein